MLDDDPIRSREYRKLLDAVAARDKALAAFAARGRPPVRARHALLWLLAAFCVGGVVFHQSASKWMALLVVVAIVGYFFSLMALAECMGLRRRVDALQVLLLQEMDKNKAM